MTYCGHIQNGGIVLEQPVTLPEGSRVQCVIVVVDEHDALLAAPAEGRYADLLKYAGIVKGTPPDASQNHDRYLYGDAQP